MTRRAASVPGQAMISQHESQMRIMAPAEIVSAVLTEMIAV
jgi:hypothetical protein